MPASLHPAPMQRPALASVDVREPFCGRPAAGPSADPEEAGLGPGNKTAEGPGVFSGCLFASAAASEQTVKHATRHVTN